MKTVTIYHRDGREKTVDVHEGARLAGAGTVGAGKDWSFVKPPPLNWEREVPRYKVTRDVRPAERARYRLEQPFSTVFDSGVWQYGTRAYKAGEIIETKEWPQESFHPLNFTAEKVLAFFKGALRSRLPRSPFDGDRVRLDNGLSGPATPEVRPPQPNPMDLRPAS
jgi:hypothetical protein